MVDRIAEQGAVQYGQARWSFENNDSRLAGAGQIANEIRRLVEEGKYTDYVSGLSVKGRLINRMIDVVYWPRKLFSNNELGAWYDPSDVNLTWRRNLLTYTEQFDNAAWTKTASSISSNVTATTDPLGGNTADKLIEDTANTFHQTTALASIVSGTVYTLSVYAKAAERSHVFLALQGGGAFAFAAVQAIFDLNNGTVNNLSQSNGSIEPVGNGWYRCSVYNTATSTTSVTAVPYIRLATDSTTSSYTGDGTSGIYIWGAQVEVGSTATDYQRIVTPEITYVADVQPQPILYQDAAGTIPVTAIEQPVGLMLDKSEGLVIGPELVTNGDFSNGTTGWYIGVSVSASVVSGEAEVTFAGSLAATSGNWFSAGPAVATGDTRFFTIEFDATWVSGAGSLQVATGYSIAQTIAPNTTKTRYLIAASSLRGSTGNAGIPCAVVFGATASATVWKIDNVSVKEIAGNHAYQTTPTARPVLRARYNLLTYSEQFDNAAWTKTGATVAANTTTAPDGNAIADSIIEDSSTGLHFISSPSTIAFQSGATYTQSVYLKANGRSWARLIFTATAFTSNLTVYFDVTNGIIGTTSSGITASITPVGNGWYRCTATATATTTATAGTNFVLANADNSISYTGDGTSGVFIWGADLRVTNDALNQPSYQRIAAATDYDVVGFKPYLAFDGSDDWLVTNSIDFSTVTSDGEARRNLLTYPSAFDNAAWIKQGATVGANVDTAPNGSLTADKLTEDSSASAAHGLALSVSVSSATYTYSTYFKQAERNWCRISTNIASTSAWFDLSSGTLGTVDAGIISANITSVGNGWYRCSVEFTGALNTIVIRLGTADGVVTYTGDGTSGIYIWGAQLEVGSSATDFQDIGTDKMTVWAGVRKLATTVNQVALELSASRVANAGAFSFFAPANPAATYSFISKGTLDSGVPAISAANFAEPITNVITGIGNISGDSSVLRVNGNVEGSSTTDQGAGNYGNYPLYIGRRGGTTLPFNGRLYGLIVRGTQSTDAEITNTETWLNNKTGAY